MDHLHAQGAQEAAVHLRTRPPQVIDAENRYLLPEVKQGIRQGAADEATYASDEDATGDNVPAFCGDRCRADVITRFDSHLRNAISSRGR